MVPEGWRLLTLEELANIERGKFSIRPRNDPRYFGGNIPFVQTGDVGAAGTFLTKFSQTLNDAGLKVSKLFPKNTILITIAANIGHTAITTFDVACPDSIVAIQAREENAHFFWLKMALEMIKNDLDSKATQNAQKNINLEILRPILFKTPPIPEQVKIAEILLTWDKAITTTEKLLANSEQQKKALMQQLLTGKKRFVGFNSEWQETTICNLLTESKKSSIENNPRYRLTVKLNLKGITHREFRGTEAEDATAHFVRRCGQFIYGKQNFHKGAFGIIPAHFDRFETSQDIPCFDFTNICNPNWFFYLCSQEWFYKGLENHMTGTGSKRLNPRDFFSIKVPLPGLSEQRKIASVLSNIDYTIEALRKKIGYIKQEKKSLMQQLLTGKRRVSLGDNR